MAYNNRSIPSMSALTSEDSQDLFQIHPQNERFRVENESLLYDFPVNLSESVAWTAAEDSRLVDLAIEHNKDWKIIQHRFPERKTKELRNRFLAIQQTLPFSQEESQLIKDLYLMHGADWRLLSSQLVLHSPERIKYFFFKAILPKISSDKLKFLSFKKNSNKSNETDETVILESILNNKDEGTSSNIESETIQTQLSSDSHTCPSEQVKRQKVQEIYKKMATLQAFISKTEKEIHNLRKK